MKPCPDCPAEADLGGVCVLLESHMKQSRGRAAHPSSASVQHSSPTPTRCCCCLCLCCVLHCCQSQRFQTPLLSEDQWLSRNTSDQILVFGVGQGLLRQPSLWTDQLLGVGFSSDTQPAVGWGWGGGGHAPPTVEVPCPKDPGTTKFSSSQA